MYIIVMSAHSHMLLGSLMKTSTTERGGRGSKLCVRHSSRGWRQCKLLSVKPFCGNAEIVLTAAICISKELKMSIL